MAKVMSVLVRGSGGVCSRCLHMPMTGERLGLPETDRVSLGLGLPETGETRVRDSS